MFNLEVKEVVVELLESEITTVITVSCADVAVLVKIRDCVVEKSASPAEKTS